MPSETSEYALGNLTTCDIQGFLGQLGAMGCIFYNFSLAVYQLAVVKLSMKEIDIAKKLEPWLHVVPNLFSIVSAIFLVAKNQFAPLPDNHLCWIGAYPQGCIGNADVECIRGGKLTPYYAEFLALIPFFVIYVLEFTIMMIIVHTIVQQKRKSKRWSFGEKSDSSSDNCDRQFKQDTNSRKLAKMSNALKQTRQCPISKGVRFSDQNITIPTDRLIISGASRSGNKLDPLAFDLRKVKEKIRRESNLDHNAPIVLSTRETVNDIVNSARLRSSHTSTRSRKPGTNATNQCLLYLLNFLLCFIFSAISRIYGIMGREAPFTILLLARIFIPLNGFFLILVYSRPQVQFLRSRNQDLTLFQAFVLTFKAGADNNLSETQYCNDINGIDAPRLPQAERERRQEIVRQQYKRKSVSYKLYGNQLKILEGCDGEENDNREDTGISVRPIVADTHHNQSSSDIETGDFIEKDEENNE